ncbi:MAG: ABC transporter ATP-binding protein [Lachnospiraceae bacterium]|nr:ABC transporter ATP-binding protein [Lachnospiraceae bacterium]
MGRRKEKSGRGRHKSAVSLKTDCNMPETGHAVRVQELSWEPKTAGRPVLCDVSFELGTGHFYGILGANGSGKTSLLRHLLRLLPSGKAVCLGEKFLEEYRQKDLARILSYVPQSMMPESDFTARELVMMGRTPHIGRFEALKEEDKRAVQEAMRLTNCLIFADQSILCLSGGELQRVVTARAIAQGTEWIFLDEPVSHLDLRHQMELMAVMAELCEKKAVTVVAVLHDINLALRYCDELLIMKEGKLFASGKTKEVASVENLKAVYGMEFEEAVTVSGQRYLVPVTGEKGL